MLGATFNTNLKTAEAFATGSAGGLIGFNSTETYATNDSKITAEIAAGADVTATDAVLVSAQSATSEFADASSASIGLIAARTRPIGSASSG